MLVVFVALLAAAAAHYQATCPERIPLCMPSNKVGLPLPHVHAHADARTVQHMPA